ncbi:MAG: hypothetical protein CVU57_28320 [Deltaproteobacteria bacterium HGW-Deltaproteobacteria-15]|nr:MAG: hypothetical protein CVU57_28320 [Deltaproteobacteria bacterium HGW-Deltaproteobacteria-15]
MMAPLLQNRCLSDPNAGSQSRTRIIPCWKQFPAMKRKRVSDILLPYNEVVPLEPSVGPDEKIVHAIELMVTKNLKCVAVVSNQRPIGMVRLEDAFEKLGLRSWKGKHAPMLKPLE